GRLGEAVEPMQAGLANFVAQEDWNRAAITANNISELQQTLGDLAVAIEAADESVAHADRSGDMFERMVNRTTLADALHQAGRVEEAMALFRAAEALQAERQPQYPRLYAVQGFRYCDLLLAPAERAAWRRRAAPAVAVAPASLQACREAAARAKRALEWATGKLGLLTTALDDLTLGRAALYTALLQGEPSFDLA